MMGVLLWLVCIAVVAPSSDSPVSSNSMVSVVPTSVKASSLGLKALLAFRTPWQPCDSAEHVAVSISASLPTTSTDGLWSAVVGGVISSFPSICENLSGCNVDKDSLICFLRLVQRDAPEYGPFLEFCFDEDGFGRSAILALVSHHMWNLVARYLFFVVFISSNVC